MDGSQKNKNYHLYNIKLQSLVNALRNDMTRAEAVLWKYILRAKKMKGYSFKRRRRVLNYIADFICKELSLIIEIDGITHTLEEVNRNDKLRQKAFEQAGFTVLRFTDDEVLHEASRVAEKLENWIDVYEKVHPHPRLKEIRNKPTLH